MTRCVAFTLVILLAGCMEPSPTRLYVDEEAGSASSLVDPDAVPDVDGDGKPDLDAVDPAWINVTVVAADDNMPINGTGVVFRFYDCDWCDASIQQVGLRTDAEGCASMQLYAEVQVAVIAGDHQAYTTEEAPRVQSVLGVERDVRLRLYSVERAREIVDSYPLTIFENGEDVYGEPERGQVWRFHDEPEVQAGYMSRLQSVKVGVAWDNSPTSNGWLQALVGPEENSASFATTEAPGFPSTEPREPGSYSFVDTWNAKATRENDGMPATLRLGVMPAASVVTVDGLAYTVSATATFQGSDRFEVRIE